MRSMECRNWPPLLTPRANEAKVRPHAWRSHGSWKTGSVGSASTGPKPSMPPRSCTPSIDSPCHGPAGVSRGGGRRRLHGPEHAQEVLAEDAAHLALGEA